MAFIQASATVRPDGKVALITGSSRECTSLFPSVGNAGREHALELASRGGHIVANYSRSSQAAQEVVKSIEGLGRKAAIIQADISKLADISMLFTKAPDHFIYLDIVISDSGVETFGHISEITLEEFDRVFAINTRGQLLVPQQAHKCLTSVEDWLCCPQFRRRGSQSKIHPFYSVSKAAVAASVRCIVQGMGDEKIRVKYIAPGGIKTDMYAEHARKYIPGCENWLDEKVEEVTI